GIFIPTSFMCAKSKKIILLNPPAKGIFIRDYYCSFSSKADYYWPAQDLVILSGILSGSYDVVVIDAIGDKLSFKACRGQILAENFDAIIFATGTATLADDIKFIEMLKQKKSLRL
ncbi:MAG: hypothetical protein V2A64_01430, partial [Candidatus Omnitrophota bacterium]